MTLPLQGLPLGLLPFVAMLLVFVVLDVTAVRWWLVHHGSKSESSADRSEESHGYPLAPWHYVYDLDKSDAKWEVASTNEQAKTLVDASKKCRRRWHLASD